MSNEEQIDPNKETEEERLLREKGIEEILEDPGFFSDEDEIESGHQIY
jgi:hypothetical protein